MSTIAEVARKAGVSTATVSRVLNSTDYVSDETRQKVQAAVEELQYVPNAHAGRLRMGVSKTIGLAVVDFANPFWGEVARGVNDVALENGYDLILRITQGDPQHEQNLVKSFAKKQVDGVILPWVSTDWGDLVALDQNGVSIIVLGNAPKGYPIDTFSVGNVRGGYLATKHLLDLGHRRIAYLSADFTRERERGFRKAMDEYGVLVDEKLIFRDNSPSEYKRGELLVDEMCSLDEMPTAIFGYSDVTAIGVWLGLEKRGLHIPEDISLVGFDDIPMASLIRNGLTTVTFSHYDYGRNVAEFLMKRIASQVPGTGQHYAVEPTLVVRGSTRPI